MTCDRCGATRSGVWHSHGEGRILLCNQCDMWQRRCRCGHVQAEHYQDWDDAGCIECNKARIQTGDGDLCRSFREVVASAHATDGA